MWLWRRGINIRRALVVGAGVAGQRIMKDIVERPELGYKLSGYVSDEDDPAEKDWRCLSGRCWARAWNGNGMDTGRKAGQREGRASISGDKTSRR